jgi:hypothetical protein
MMKMKFGYNTLIMIFIMVNSTSLIGCQHSDKPKEKASIEIITQSKNVSKITPLPFLLKNGKKIFVDSTSFKPITGIEYEDLKFFSYGLAAAKKNGKWGYVDKQEKVIIPFIYRLAFEFIDGIARVDQGQNKAGYINTKGEVVLPLIYSAFRNRNNDMQTASIYDNSTRKFNSYLINLIDFKVTPISSSRDPSEGLLATKRNEKWGFIDRNGIVKIQFKYDDAYPFSEGLARVKLNDNWFIIDMNGEVIFQGVSKYFDMDFHEGLIAVEREGKWGFLDKLGNEIIEFKYDAVTNFKNGFASVKLNNAWGLIDKNDNVVIPFHYSSVGEYVDGLVLVTSKESKSGFIDLKGNVIIELQYYGANNFDNGLASVYKLVKTSEGTEYRYGLINKKGEVIIPLEYNVLYVNKHLVQLEVYSENSRFYSDLSGNLLREK